MKGLVIFNPHARSGETAERIDAVRLEIAQGLQQSLTLEKVDWVDTEHTGHATQLAREATQQGYDYIFAGGGDGTINEVLNGIMSQSQRPIFGVLPFGTSNDFFAALKTAEANRPSTASDEVTMPLDVGEAVFDEVKRYFCLTTGLGLLSWANEQYLDASRRFGRCFAHIPAAIATIFGYRFLPNARISENGKRFRRRRILAVVVNNSPVIAGGTPLTPQATINDGYLDVCIIRPVSFLRLIWLAFQVSQKAHTHSRSVILERITTLTVITKQALPIHIDGELIPEINSKARRMSITVLPKALQVVIPSLCEFDLDHISSYETTS